MKDDRLISLNAAIHVINDALLSWSNMPEWRENKIVGALDKLPSAQPDNQINLCDSCDYSYPNCPSKNVIFGNGVGNDNICACNKYKPSAQPKRKKGHWIEVNDNYNRISGRCSVCGWESHMYEDDVVGMDFCPNCGARLDGEQNDT